MHGSEFVCHVGAAPCHWLRDPPGSRRALTAVWGVACVQEVQDRMYELHQLMIDADVSVHFLSGEEPGTGHVRLLNLHKIFGRSLLKWIRDIGCGAPGSPPGHHADCLAADAMAERLLSPPPPPPLPAA